MLAAFQFSKENSKTIHETILDNLQTLIPAAISFGRENGCCARVFVLFEKKVRTLTDR